MYNKFNKNIAIRENRKYTLQIYHYFCIELQPSKGKST